MKKFQATQDRDAVAVSKLRKLGWQTLVVWECETKATGQDDLAHRIGRFLQQ